MAHPTSGGTRVDDPGVVPAEDPATGEPDPAKLKESMERASRGAPPPDSPSDDAARRRAARGAQGENDAGA
jgi:hypothetical protein